MNHSPQKNNEMNSLWGRLFSIEHDDESLNAHSWFKKQPCKTYSWLGKNIVITQPSSSVWVYLLGILTTLLGIYFIATDAGHISRMLWGISLILWGVGALIAGTSYQAFGYQLKCAGRPRVAWTSWWEVIYLIFQQVSINVMLVAVAYSCLTEAGQFVATISAIVLSIIYTVMVLWGAFKPIKSLITFELMVHFCTPSIIFCIALNTWRYWQLGDLLDLALLGVWFGLIITMWLYEYYYKADFTEKLWKEGKWFSENDVLHVALILWIGYLALIVEPFIKDLSN